MKVWRAAVCRAAVCVAALCLALLPPGARAAEQKPVWVFASTTAGTLNFTNYAFSLKGVAGGRKYESDQAARSKPWIMS